MSWLRLKEQGNKQFQLKNYHEAVDLYTKAIEIDSSQDVLYSNRSLCYLNLNQINKAEKDLLKAIEINGFNIKTIKRLGNIYILQGSFQKAKRQFQLACRIEKGVLNEEKVKNFTEIYDNDDVKKVMNLIEKETILEVYFNEGEYEKAEKELEEILKECGYCKKFKLLYLKNLLFLLKFDKVSNFLKTKLSEDEKEDDDFIFLTCKLLYFENKYEKVKVVIKSRLSTKTINLYNEYQQLLDIINQIEEYKNKGKEYFLNEDYEKAIESYEKILSIDTSNINLISIIYFNIGLCEHRLHKYNHSLEYLNKSLLLKPNYTNALLRRGILHMELHNFDEAEKDLEKVLVIDPSLRDAKKRLSQLKYEKSKKKTNNKDYYKILGLPYHANDYEIRQSYKKLAAKWHPDKNNSNDMSLSLSKKMFEEISEAYEVLSNKEKRRIYDHNGYNSENLNEEKFEWDDFMSNEYCE